MKRIILGWLAMLLVLIVAACSKNNVEDGTIVLPDLEGYQKDEIIEVFEELKVDIYFVYNKPSSIEQSDVFIGYGQFLLAGDRVESSMDIPIIIYETYEDLSAYFFYEELMYDGPILDLERYASIDLFNPRGGYVEVENPDCTDGDTAVFDYPDALYMAIESGAKSTRFLNMDTPETYPGGEEEWGKPASVYTCELLSDATSVILQTDPGDELLGNYGRLLAWVWVKLEGDDYYSLLNYMVVRQGLGEVAYEFGAGETISYGNFTYNEWMHLAETRAREDSLGQWGDLLDYYWNYQTESPNENWN